MSDRLSSTGAGLPGPGAPPLEGLLVLDKPAGITSRDAVNRIVRLVGRKTRVGHAGTLDPLATGVLVVAIGAATRLIEYVQRMPKTYRAVVRLGARSETDDADGTVEPVPDVSIPGAEQIGEALAAQTGTILQQPPRYSALKLEGQRAYDLARRGEEVELRPREVHVARIEILAYAWPLLELEIDCGSGTYIRSIARDLGEALGCGGLIEALRRTRIGPFTVAEAVDPIALDREGLGRALRPPIEAVGELPQVGLDAGQVTRIVQGQSLSAPPLLGVPGTGGEVALLGPDGALVAIATADGAEDGRVRPTRVLARSS